MVRVENNDDNINENNYLSSLVNLISMNSMRNFLIILVAGKLKTFLCCALYIRMEVDWEQEGERGKLINSREIITNDSLPSLVRFCGGEESRAIQKLISSQLEKLRKQETLKILLE